MVDGFTAVPAGQVQSATAEVAEASTAENSGPDATGTAESSRPDANGTAESSGSGATDTAESSGPDATSTADRTGPDATGTAAPPPGARVSRLITQVRVSRLAYQGLLALAVYLAVAIIGFALPLIAHPQVPQVGQGYADPNFYIWSLRWWTWAIAHGLNPLHSTQIGSPAGYDLSWTTTVPTVAVVLTPITAVFGPIVSFNLTMFLSAPLAAWAAFLAARRLTGRFWAALVGGVVYGFIPFEVDQIGAGHPNLSVVLLLPLMLWLTLLWRDGKLRWPVFVGLMAITMAAEFYIFEETFAAMAVLWILGLLIGLALARRADRTAVARLAALIAVAGLTASALALPYLIYQVHHTPASGFTRATPNTSLGLAGLQAPEYAIALGIALALLVVSWKNRLGWLLAILLVITVGLAAGPRYQIGSWRVPWARLWDLPFVKSAEPLRFLTFAALFLSMILALWLALPARNKLLLAVQWAAGLTAAGFVIANISVASPSSLSAAGHTSASANAVPTFISSGLYRHYLRPGETVVVISKRGNAGMLFQADTDFYLRLNGGFINSALSAYGGLPIPVGDLAVPTRANEQQFWSYVRQNHVGALIVESAWNPPWTSVLTRVGGLHGTSVGGVFIFYTAANAHGAP